MQNEVVHHSISMMGMFQDSDLFMKILILANYDGGLYRFRRELVEELLKEHEVYFCLPDGQYVAEMVVKYLTDDMISKPGYTMCSPTSRSSLTWELSRNAESCPRPLNQNLNFSKTAR